ncbi:unnamed protein product, partial [Mesorhabditis spiculigera]
MNLLIFILVVLSLSTAFAAPPGIKRCVNGQLSNGICICDYGFTGTMCHREMHCDTRERLPNGSCSPCQKGWAGTDCDRIDCGQHGKPNGDSTRCNCEPPYSGAFCTNLESGDVIYSYNSFFTSIGPLGVLLVIPLAIMVYVCNRTSARLRTAKVEKHLETHIVQGTDIDPKVLHKLLKK